MSAIKATIVALLVAKSFLKEAEMSENFTLSTLSETEMTDLNLIQV